MEEKVEIVLYVRDNNYKAYREAAEIFNNRHPGKNIHNTLVKLEEVVHNLKETRFNNL